MKKNDTELGGICAITCCNKSTIVRCLSKPYAPVSSLLNHISYTPSLKAYNENNTINLTSETLSQIESIG